MAPEYTKTSCPILKSVTSFDPFALIKFVPPDTIYIPFSSGNVCCQTNILSFVAKLNPSMVDMLEKGIFVVVAYLQALSIGISLI